MTTPGGVPRGTGEPDDGELVGRALAGDRGAFEALVRRHQGLVFRIAGGFLWDRADVEDVAQEAFLRAFEALPTFRAGAAFGPWVARIATRCSYDRLRRRRRRAGEVRWEDLPPAERRAAQVLAAGGAAEDHAALRDLAERALAALGPRDRQVLVLVDALGFTPGEAAGYLGCSALAARVRLHRARRALRRVAGGLMDGMVRGG